MILSLPASVYENFNLIPKVVKKLGQGAFGGVFLFRGKDGVDYAVKVLKEDDFLDREWNVAQIIKGKSQYLIQLYDKVVLEDDSVVVIKMEFANAGPLTRAFQKNLPYTGMKYDSIGIMWQLLSGINTLHVNNAMHRDLKPDNIIIHKETKEGKEHVIVKITDYGLSRPIATTEVAETQCGSPLFLAPEVLNVDNNPDGVKYNFKADIWSLGLLFHMIVTDGRHPFEHANDLPDLIRIVQEPLKCPDGLTKPPAPGPGVITDPAALDACWRLIRHMLCIDQYGRLGAAEAMRHELFARWGPSEAKEFISPAAPPAAAAPPSPPAPVGAPLLASASVRTSASSSSSSFGGGGGGGGGGIHSSASPPPSPSAGPRRRHYELTDVKAQNRCFSDLCPYDARVLVRVFPQPFRLRLDCPKCKTSFVLNTKTALFVEAPYQTTDLPQ